MKSKSINFRLKPDQVEALEKAAQQAGMTVSDFVRKVVADQINSESQSIIQLLTSIDGRLNQTVARLLNLELGMRK